MKMFTSVICQHFIRTIIATAAVVVFSFSSIAQLTWVQVPAYDSSITRNLLRGISGTSSTDVWAVGDYDMPTGSAPATIQKNLILHWDGSSFTSFSPNNTSISQNVLWDVEALDTNNVWAAGTFTNYANTARQIMHWNGSSWVSQNPPGVTGGSFIYSLDAISPTDIWAVGGQAGSPTSPCYTLHYNGSTWTPVTVPPVGSYHNVFNEVNGISANDVWAVGYHGSTRGSYHFLAMHWNGTAWANSPLPTSLDTLFGELSNITMVASNDVWASGGSLTGVAITLHWNGTTWARIPPTGGEGPFAVIGANNIYSSGARISHYNGAAWSIADSMNQLSDPALSASIAFSNWDVWSAGRTIDSNSVFSTLIYRSVANYPTFANGAAQISSARAGTVLVLDTLLKTMDPDVSQILRYGIARQPAHGTLGGFPTSAITQNGFAMPSGTNYTPAAGFTGLDSFDIRVSIGSLAVTTTIVLNITSGTLPVVLSGYTVVKQNKDAVVKWKTTAEINMASFVVEHSTNSNVFKPIATIAATNSTEGKAYEILHTTPVNGWNYYRLKALDRDGKTSIYPVKSIVFNTSENDWSIYPNPVSGNKFTLQLNNGIEGKQVFKLYTNNGQIIYSKPIANGATIVEIRLPKNILPGHYQASVGNGKRTLPIVIQ